MTQQQRRATRNALAGIPPDVRGPRLELGH